MWQSWVVAAFLAVCGLLASRSIRIHVHNEPDVSPSHAASLVPLVGWFWAVFAFRVAVVAFFIVSLAYSGLPGAWVYYTVWGFTLQTVYFVWALVDQWRRRQNWGHDVVLDRELRYLNACFDTSVTVSVLVCALFWVAVQPVDPTFVLYWNVYVQHGANVMILLVEFAVNSFTIRWRNVGCLVLFPVVYAVATWIGQETWHRGLAWPYFFMEIASPYAPLWYAAVAAVHVLLHLAMAPLTRIKRKLEPGHCPHEMAGAHYRLPLTPRSSDDLA